MKGLLITIGALVFLSGCGGVLDIPEVVEDPIKQEDVVVLGEEYYQNSRFGYAIDVPEDLEVYAITSNNTAVGATENSELIFLVEGDTNFFTIRGIDEARSPHEWLTQNLSFFYPAGDAALRVGEFANDQALFLRGAGTGDSPAQVIVFRLGEYLIVISYEQDTDVFSGILDSFVVL